MSQAFSFLCLGFPKAVGGPKGLVRLLVKKLAGARAPQGHLASPTCVLTRINYHSQGTPSLKAVLFSWQLASVSGEQ